MIKIVYDEVNKLIANGPDQKSIDNIVLNKLKDHKEAIKENRNWLRWIMSDDFNDEDYIDYDYEKFWSKLTPKQMKKAAKKFLDTSKALQVVTSSSNVEGL